MKRLIVRYNFLMGDQDRLTNFFLYIKRCITLYIRIHLAQQFALLPAYFPDNEKPTVMIHSVGFFLKN